MNDDEQLQLLWDLQLVDARILKRQRRLREIEAGPLCAAEARRLLETKAAAEQALSEAKAHLCALETELAQTEERRKQTHKRLYGGTVTATRELNALEHELAALKERQGELDGQVLQAMDRVTELESEASEAIQASAALLDQYRVEKSSMDAEKQHIEAELTDLTVRRERAAQRVETRHISRYETLRQRGNGYGMSPVEGDHCKLCRTTISVTVMKRLQSGAVVQCENCSRILYPAKES